MKLILRVHSIEKITNDDRESRITFFLSCNYFGFFIFLFAFEKDVTGCKALKKAIK